MNVTVAPELPLHVAVVEIAHVVVSPSSVKLSMWSDEVTAAALEKSKTPAAEKLRTAVRQMLKHGKFKASGRSKPAHEYLLRCAQEDGALPRINGPVDVLNTCSLFHGLPISLLSIARSSRNLLVRYGRADEGYIFNSSGQVLDVEDLVVTCDATREPGVPVGSPIKDSMVGKIEASDQELVAIIYAPKSSEGQAIAQAAAEMFAEAMVTYCGAKLAASFNP